ncbi:MULTISPECIES: DUF481 domain-containing protein [unclassified Spirosoma]|uniref:DUF481 domain-containing protein n=1 Tax=unclassified Spirosoma TaxID=2621999 RepID=UPI00095D1B4F|nr:MULTISPECIES: DUF481 domain-containing protein [unclassified Spirosoma]MBN8821061.1 DUF481 domain-containing protein [Spirosoma sp.]OJW79299.1 MAG: hypothetical protein BGO59_12220 [Spirosoma sp. 48-14]
MREAILSVFLLTGLLTVSRAQLNESDSARFQIRMSLTGNFQQGNVEVSTVRSKLDLIISPVRPWVFKSQNSSMYQSFYSVKADNDLFSRNYLYYHPERRVYPFAIAYVSTNFRRKIDLRYFTGAGTTWQLISKPRHVLKLSAGTVFENTRFMADMYNETRYNGSQTIALWRGTAWLGGWHYLLDNHLRLYYDAYYQPAFSDAHNYRCQYDIGLDLPIWRGLAFNAIYTFTHENVVITKIQPDDKMLTVGLAYTLRSQHKP